MIEFYLNYYTLVYAISVAICGFLLFFTWYKKEQQIGAYFFDLFLILFFWSFVGMIEVSIVSVELKHLLSKFEYIGAIFTPVIFFLFAIHYNKLEKWMNSLNMILLLLIPIVTLVVAFTNEYHRLVWKSYHLADVNLGTVVPIVYEYGFWFWFIHVPYSYLLLLLGSAFFLKTYLKLKKPANYQAGIILLGVLVPLLANLLYISGLFMYPGLDITRVAFSITGLLFLYAAFKWNLLDLMPVARNILFDKISEGIIVLDSDDRLIDINPAALSMLKRSLISSEVRNGMNIKTYFKKKSYDIDSLFFISANLSDNSKRVIKLNNQYIESSLNNLFDSNNELYGRLFVLRDITELKKKEFIIENNSQKLDKALDYLKLATKSANIGVWDYNVQTQSLNWDDQNYYLYGLDPNKDKVKNYDSFSKLCHPEDLDRVQLELAKAIKEKAKIDISYRVVLPDKSVSYLSVFANPVLNASNHVEKYIGVTIDVTKEKEIDKTKSEFVSLASHQLRTPLTAISWYAEMLLAGDAGKLTKDQVDYLKEIVKNNKRIIDLVNSLLNISKLEMGNLSFAYSRVNVSKMIKQLLDENELLIKSSNIKIAVNISKKAPKNILSDQKFLMIVLQNLLSNAIHYSKNGAKVAIFIYTDKSMSNIIFEFKDEGIGIPKNQQSQIFSKLFRAKNAQQVDTNGSGIGLYMTKYLVENFGGRISFVSQEGKSTTFYVSLPINLK